MKKICKISGIEFEITNEDLEFYKKMGVPEPTLCLEERDKRRYVFRNERKLYHRECDITGKKIISFYHEGHNFPVYEKDYWWSDKWEALDYGRDFDFGKSFFEQFAELRNEVPRASMMIFYSENCDWSPYATHSKDCYLSVSCTESEAAHYSYQVNKSTNCFDCSVSHNCEICYECVNCVDCLNLKFSQYCIDCNNSFFLKECSGCTDCFACWGLQNAQYYFLNKKYSKEEYFEKVKEVQIGKFSNLTNSKKYFEKFIRQFPHKYMFGIANENSTGNNLKYCKNAINCFDAINLEDCKNVYPQPIGGKDLYDVSYSPDSELLYEAMSASHNKNGKFMIHSWYMVDSLYCDETFSSNNMFGCCGLKNKEYCILNKQYSKEEYFKLKEKIIDHMKTPLLNKEGLGVVEWGEFFPSSLSPFGYNETIAMEYYPMTKKEVLSKGGKWKEDEKLAKYKGTKIDLADNIEDINEGILKEILECESCQKNYRIIKSEFDFYKKYNLPIPRKCPNCRHSDRIKLRNPRKLFDRDCDKCKKEIKTTFGPDREETVYCEECYEKEIY